MYSAVLGEPNFEKRARFASERETFERECFRDSSVRDFIRVISNRSFSRKLSRNAIRVCGPSTICKARDDMKQII